ncbi:MAG TPA: PBP1A family penicillin-binding protein [Methylovirgula sp.]|nr:PBP1A family penicillin-binding protein [Methylovirgula sp.]
MMPNPEDFSPGSTTTTADATRKRRHPALFLLACVFALAFIAACVAGGVVAWALVGLQFPSPAEVTSRRVIVLEASDGQIIMSKGAFRLPPVAAKDMPNVVNAVISVEDRRFYQTGAVDPRSILRAFIENEQKGQIVAGGSTITQQLVKMFFVGSQRTYKRKIQEAAIAIWLEHHLTKDEILTSYLNNVYLGSGAYGFPAAAKFYFGKDAKDLSLPEAAMLAGMIKAPVQYDPLRNLQAAQARAATVLDTMVANGKLTQEAALAAKLHPATPNPSDLSSPSAGWFADWINDKANAITGSLHGTIRIRTTLDPHLQETAQRIVDTTLGEYGADRHASEAALVAMRPDGAVVAMVGGGDYAQSQFNRAVQAKRQPGSSFKLFDYYAALRNGFSLDDEVLDEPVDIKGWTPENDEQHYHGRVTLIDAFAHSLNAATVRLSQQIGISQVITAARDLGLHAPLANNPSLALGTSEVSLIDLTSAYAAVRAGVAPVEPWGIASLRMGGDQHEIKVGRPDEKQHAVQNQNEMMELLQAVVERGTGRAAALDGFAAGKTGTSQDYRDAWFIGFNDSLVVGVWVGNDDHSPMKEVFGGTLPASMWKDFMEKAGPSGSPSPTQASTEAPNAASETAPAYEERQPDAEQRAAKEQRSADEQGEADEQRPTGGQQGSAETSADDRSAATDGQSAQCDIPVCEQYYHSFRASDCTYQPFFGPRRYCDR